MSDLFANPLEEMIEFQDLKTDLQRGQGPLLVTGCLDSQKVHLLSELSDLTPWKLIVTYDDSRAREICEDYRCFDTDISLYPARDLLFYTSDIHGNLLTKQRIQVMRRVLESSGGVVVTTIDGLMEHLLPLAWMKERSLTIGAEDVVEVGKLTHALAEMGYEKVAQVEGSGQFSVRGGIIDIFPLTEEVPYRIELWGDEVDSIRTFDPESQRSIEQVDEAVIYPATEMALTPEQIQDGTEAIEKDRRKYVKKLRDAMKTEEAYRMDSAVSEVLEGLREGFRVHGLGSYIRYFCKETVSFLNYFPVDDLTIFLDEPLRLKEKAETTETEFRESMSHRLEGGYLLPGQTSFLYSAKETLAMAMRPRTLLLLGLDQKLSGMTGTAMTEEEEFAAIYNLDIIEIPTNKPVIRIDNPDVVYKNEAGKLRAIIEQIRVCHDKGQPVLVGTVSIEKSEQLSKLLRKAGIPHNVLNAKHHEKEAEIVAQAGKLGAVTIATNMAGRGTDIMLGGNAEYLAKADLRKAGFTEEVIAEATGYAETEDEEILKARTLFAERMAEHKKSIDAEADRVREAGGLYIIGTERHESRRIDNQLRGRSGRQGDPGESRFYIALTDDVMRLFGSERMQSMMETLRVDEDTPLDHKMLSNAIEQAQRTVESRNFQARKNVLEYDDVMNVQRNVIYEERRKVLDGEDLQEHVQHMIRTVITGDIAAGMAEHHPENDKDLHEILAPLEKLFPCDLSYTAEELHKLTPDTLSDAVYDCAMKAYAAREEAFGLQPDGTPLMRELERVVMLRVVDEYWMDHLEAMDDLRQGIGLRAYGNVKPVDEYKRAGFDMFDEMVNGIQTETVRRLFTVRVRREQKLERKTVARGAVANAGGDDSEKKRPVRRTKKPGRNDPCPCGKLRPNGLPMKYKDCCGKDQ